MANTTSRRVKSPTKRNSNPDHHISEPSSAPLPQLPPNLQPSSATWKIWSLWSDRSWRGLWSPVDQQALSEHLSGASSQGQGPSSRTPATAPWHLTLQVFNLLERAKLRKTPTTNTMILASFALKANYQSTFFLVYVKFSDQIKINLNFFTKLLFPEVLLIKKISFL